MLAWPNSNPILTLTLTFLRYKELQPGGDYAKGKGVELAQREQPMPISCPPRARPTVRPAGASWAPWLGQLRPIRGLFPVSPHLTELSPLINTPNVRCLPPLAVARDHYKALAITKHTYDLMHYVHFFFSSRNESFVKGGS